MNSEFYNIVKDIQNFANKNILLYKKMKRRLIAFKVIS